MTESMSLSIIRLKGGRELPGLDRDTAGAGGRIAGREDGGYCMMIRNDYTTNSSSSFILARKTELSQQQKEAIVEFVVNRMLGQKVASSREELHEYAERYRIDSRTRDRMQAEIDRGLSLYAGYVSFAEDETAYLRKGLWRAVGRVDPSSFVGIDTSLEY